MGLPKTISPIEKEHTAPAHSQDSSSPATPLFRLRQLYLLTAVLLFNTFVAFIVANLLLAYVFWMKDAAELADRNSQMVAAARGGQLFNADGSPVDNGKRNSYQMAWIDYTAYGNLDPAYVSEVLDEFYTLSALGLMYQPWVQFAEPPYQGKHVTVETDARGFPRRRTVNPTNPHASPVVEILVLGGSTTFGYNVSDEHTWPSYLSEILNRRSRAESLNRHVEVLNYGRGYYYPSQETALLIDLLRNGHRPSQVIFLDGVNTGGEQDVPEFYEQARRQFRNLQFTEKSVPEQSWTNTLNWIPMMRLARSIGNRLFPTHYPSVAQRVSEDSRSSVNHVLNNFLQNRELSQAVCKTYGIPALFILQPHALVAYAPTLYRRPLPDEFFTWSKLAQETYARLSADPGLLNLSGLFQVWGADNKAIIDELHYSPAFNRFLAEHISKHIDLKSLAPRRFLIDESAATGLPRHLSK